MNLNSHMPRTKERVYLDIVSAVRENRGGTDA